MLEGGESLQKTHTGVAAVTVVVKVLVVVVVPVGVKKQEHALLILDVNAVLVCVHPNARAGGIETDDAATVRRNMCSPV